LFTEKQPELTVTKLPAHKNAAFHSMVHRICNFNLSDEKYDKEKKRILEMGRVIGYSAKIILKIILEHEEIIRKQSLSTFYHLTDRNQSTKRISVPFFPNDIQYYE
jgi:hypothetical protein